MTDSSPRNWLCCDESSCARSEITRALNPDNPVENDIDRAATVVAQHCPMLDQGGLEYCFSRTFELPAACQLFDRFCESYEAARTQGVAGTSTGSAS